MGVQKQRERKEYVVEWDLNICKETFDIDSRSAANLMANVFLTAEVNYMLNLNLLILPPSHLSSSQTVLPPFFIPSYLLFKTFILTATFCVLTEPSGREKAYWW